MPLVNADSLDTSPPDWLVDGMIPRVGLGFLHGPSYTGKSLVADTELALAVANGVPFFGHDTVQGTAVVCLGEGLYDAGVRKQARLARQARDDAAKVAEFAAAHGNDAQAVAAFTASLPAYTDDSLFMITEPFTVPVSQQGAPAPSMDATVRDLHQLPDLELVVLDALSDFSGGLSISNDASANRFILGVKNLVRELDCCVLVVGHDTQDGKKMLGAGRLYNASDYDIRVIPDDTQPGEPARATLICTKAKYGPEFEPVSYAVEPVAWMEPVRDEAGQVVPGRSARVSTATVRVASDEGGGLRMPGGQRRERPALPDIQPVERPRKRSGLLRQHGPLHGPVTASAAAFADGSLQRDRMMKYLLSK